MQNFEYLKIYDLISKMKDSRLKRKFDILIGSIIQSNQTQKTMWYKSIDDEINKIAKAKLEIYQNNKLVKSEKIEKLSRLIEREAYLTMETIAKTKVEFEYLLNLIISMSFDSVPRIMKRILKGDFDNSKISCEDYLKKGIVEKILRELYSVKHLEFHNVQSKDKNLLKTIYKYELDFILDFLDFIKEYLNFLRKVRNNMYHNFAYLTPTNEQQIMYPKEWIIESVPIFVFNPYLDKGYFDSYYSGKTVITYYTRIMNICVILEKIPIFQYIRSIERNQRLIDILVSPEAKKQTRRYFQILEKYGFPRGKPGMKISRDEIEPSKTGKNMIIQKSLNKKFEDFLKKYPPT